MESNTTRLVARIAWVLPLLLLYLTFDQAQVAHDLRQTWELGAPATAEVLAYENADRVDVTYGFIDLRIPLSDGTELVKEKLSLPHTLLPRVEGEQTLAVHVRPGAAQEVVIDRLMPAHALIAAAQAGMALIGALLLATGLFFWNRWLRRKAQEPPATEKASGVETASA